MVGEMNSIQLCARITHVKRHEDPLRLPGTKEHLCEPAKLDLRSVYTGSHLVHVYLGGIRTGHPAGVGHCEADLGAEAGVHHLEVS